MNNDFSRFAVRYALVQNVPECRGRCVVRQRQPSASFARIARILIGVLAEPPLPYAFSNTLLC